MPDTQEKVQVLFFGAVAEAVGERVIEMDIKNRQTLADILNDLSSQHSRLKEFKLLTAINEEYVGADRVLTAGDRVAIFSPVSGG